MPRFSNFTRWAEIETVEDRDNEFINEDVDSEEDDVAINQSSGFDTFLEQSLNCFWKHQITPTPR